MIIGYEGNSVAVGICPKPIVASIFVLDERLANAIFQALR